MIENLTPKSESNEETTEDNDFDSISEDDLEQTKKEEEEMFKDPIKVKLVVTEIADTDFKKLQQSVFRPFLVGLNLSPKLGLKNSI